MGIAGLDRGIPWGATLCEARFQGLGFQILLEPGAMYDNARPSKDAGPLRSAATEMSPGWSGTGTPSVSETAVAESRIHGGATPSTVPLHKTGEAVGLSNSQAVP